MERVFSEKPRKEFPFVVGCGRLLPFLCLDVKLRQPRFYCVEHPAHRPPCLHDCEHWPELFFVNSHAAIPFALDLLPASIQPLAVKPVPRMGSGV